MCSRLCLFTEALFYLNDVLGIYTANLSEDDEMKGQLNSKIGVVYVQMGDNDEAHQHFEKAIHYATKCHVQAGAWGQQAYSGLGAIYALRGCYEKAVEMYHLSVTFDWQGSKDCPVYVRRKAAASCEMGIGELIFM